MTDWIPDDQLAGPELVRELHLRRRRSPVPWIYAVYHDKRAALLKRLVLSDALPSEPEGHRREARECRERGQQR